MPRTTPAARRGAILLVVLTLLTLFAAVGLTFVYYAGHQAMSATAHREAQSLPPAPDLDPELLLGYFLGQLLYDAADDGPGLESALRGHSLARGMFGLDYDLAPDGSVRRGPDGIPTDAAGNPRNVAAYSGAGRQHYDPKLPFALVPDGSPAKDDFNLINYTYFGRDRFLRDPERPGWRPGPRASGAADTRLPYASRANAPYTYPDLNNVFLAAVRSDGTVALPSYHRPWAGFGTLDPTNWRWTSDVDPTLRPGDPLYKKAQPWLKYLVLRPRPADMGPGFLPPEDAGGDVRNLYGSPGGNDSIWIDLGFPVMRAADGRKFRPLFAPLAVDLDGRVNLNVHGNLRGQAGAQHASHQGWGPWEVNPEQLVPLPGANDRTYAAALARRSEAANLLSGKPQGPGRYGRDKAPHSSLPGNAAPGPLARFYAPVDFDGSREVATGNPGVAGRPTLPLRMPGSRLAVPYQCFPAAPAWAGYGNGSGAERTGHPLLYDPFRPTAPDRKFCLSDLELLLRLHDTGSPALISDPVRLAPRFFGDPADPEGSARRRRQVTLASFDPDVPGVPGVSAALAPLRRRLDLNRHLPDYPLPDPRTGRITDATGFLVAQTARQHFAAEIFEVLWRVTGMGDPTLPAVLPSGMDRIDALRGLAQLAVNVVDFIDADDYMTPFNWFADPRTGRSEWAYGTELPRALLNEAYVEYANDPSDTGLLGKEPMANVLKGNVWVELYNPFQDDPPLTAPHRRGAAVLEMPPASGLPAYGAYRLVVAKLNSGLREPGNVRGEIPPGGGLVLGMVSSFSHDPRFGPAPAVDPRVILPADPRLASGYAGPPGGNLGFYVLGPALAPEEKSPLPPLPGRPMETLRRPEMSYLVRATQPSLLLKPSLLWQRLACPGLPPQPDPRLPLHNPYITVDFIRDVEPNYAAAVGADGPLDPPPLPPNQRASVGRRQPYAGHPSQLKKQQPAPALPDQPQHTFFRHNADANTPGPNVAGPPRNYPAFDWLMHLDRQLVSAAELLHVSAYRPHELTQQFRTGDADAQKFNHRAAWLDEAATGAPHPPGIHRALEFLGTHCRVHGMMTAATTAPDAFPAAAGGPVPYPDHKVTPAAMSGATSSGGTWRIEPGHCLVIDRGKPGEEVVRVKAVGPHRPAGKPAWFVADFLRPHAAGFSIAPVTVSERVPGKINLNTVWDEEIFLALCDPNPSSGFKEGAARAAFAKLRAARSPSETPGPGDRPLLSFAAGQQETLWRSDNATSADRVPILAAAGGAHPHQSYELMTKIFNNTTVRSHVFAVWLTVGFFEVTDDTTRPVKLGREIGRDENRHVRRRMFAIVDRSVLTANPGPRPRFDPREPVPPFATGPAVPYFSVIR